MVYEGFYAIVLVLHLVTAVFLVGPLALGATQASRLVREGDLAGLRRAQQATRGSALASVLVVALGSAMVGLGDVGGQWEFSQLWISASYALWLVAVVLTLLLVVRGLEDAADAVEGGVAAPALATRVAVGGGLAMLCWIAIVVLMVVKPGA